MNKLSIPKGILTLEQHINMADALAIVQQQLVTYKKLNRLASTKLQEIKYLLIEKFDTDSKVLKKFRKWNKKTIGNPYFAFTIALSVDYDSVEDEEFILYGHMYDDLYSRYLSEEEFNAANSAMN